MVFLLHLLVLLVEVHKSSSQSVINLPSCAVRCENFIYGTSYVADYQSRQNVLELQSPVAAVLKLPTLRVSVIVLHTTLIMGAAFVPIVMRRISRVGSYSTVFFNILVLTKLNQL